jgi:ribA/ribD-fused uncharacterized protein
LIQDLGARKMSEYDVFDRDTLLAKVRQGFQLKYLFFWGHQARKDGKIGKQCFSQWWPSPFEIAGIVYPTAEHYMMAEKARLFGDHETCEKILSASRPDVAKKLGRTVQGFDEQVWSQHCFAIVVQGNEAKFRQNEDLKEFLLETKDRILVEASPVDRIWGIGLAEDDPNAAHPEKWRGFNLLGFALMKVRSRLVGENDVESH